MDHDSTLAIVGMSGRFPGASDVAAFWDNLRRGVDSIRVFPRAAAIADGVDPAVVDHPQAVFAGGVLDRFDEFDAEFFGSTPTAARLMDPQHRVFLDAAVAALDDAGYDSRRFEGRIGVFASASPSRYLQELLSRPSVYAPLTPGQLVVDNERDFLATRTSYKLGLRGPSVTVQTACSSSLVAVHLAAQCLLGGEADLCLAGGVSVRLLRTPAYVYRPDGIESQDGRCRAFDARATGMVSGDGVGIVVLRRLGDALEAGDHIYALMLGSAINNDGGSKVGFAAPSVDGQADVIRDAQAMAGTPADTIGYVEAHGTGTPLGDPIEVAALTRAFATTRRQFCALGSVKTNVGHLDAAAGVTGLIKAVLAVHHGELPPSLHFERANPRLNLTESPFVVQEACAPWPSGAHPRRAGVSSFGVGGTNAHVVLQEAPPAPPRPADDRPRWLALSARTLAALDAVTERLATHFEAHPRTPLRDAAYTLLVGRRVWSERRYVVAASTAEAAERLRDAAAWRTASCGLTDRPVCFLFPGQGSQYVGMTRDLYEHDGRYRVHLDECLDLFAGHIDADLRAVLFPEPGGEGRAAAALERTETTQPALFAVEYALARLWQSKGVAPAAMLGHSIGEYVAACLSGAISVADATRLVAQRARLMQSAAPGRMVVVHLAEAGVVPFLRDEVSIAAVNGRAQTTLAGPPDAIAAVTAACTREGVDVVPLRTSHAFHSPSMAPLGAPFGAAVAQVRLSAPQIPYVSNVTGTWIEARQAQDPGYWVTHLRQPVRVPGPEAGVWADRPWIWLEVGPGRGLARIMSASSPDADGSVVSTLALGRREDERQQVARASGELWLAGARIDGGRFDGQERPSRISLPAYPFEGRRYSVLDQPPAGADAPAIPDSRDTPANGVEPGAERASLIARQRRVLDRQAALIARAAATIPLTPVQRWFFEESGDSQGWQQSVVIRIHERVDPKVLDERLTSVLEVQESARLRFDLARGRWTARVVPTLDPGLVDFVHLSRAGDLGGQLGALVERLRGELRIDTGPLIRGTVITAGDTDGCWVYLAAHHLMIDRFSWHLLVRDLEAACRNGGPVRPPLTSWSEWARALERWAQSPEAQAELPQWRRLARITASPLPSDRTEGRDDWGSARAVVRELERRGATAGMTGTVDAWLAAIGTALLQWGGLDRVSIDVEGHGREQILPHLDMTRTVGWATALSPLPFDTVDGSATDPVEVVRRRRRAACHGGLGYGALRYLARDPAVREALGAGDSQVLFDFSDERGRASPARRRFATLSPAPGAEHAPDAPRRHRLACRIVGGDAAWRLEWHYGGNRHCESSIVRLASLSIDALHRLAGGRRASHPTPA